MEPAFSTIAFRDPQRAEINLRLVEGQILPGAWARLATLLAQVPDPDEALNDFERYLRQLSPPLAAYIESQPAAMHYLLLVFSHSRFLSETLIQKPDLILWLHRPSGASARDRLGQLRTPEDLREELARYWAANFDLTPSVLLARFKRREYLRIMLRDVLGLGTLAEITLELSLLADVILEAALVTAEQKMTRLYGAPQCTDAAGRIQRSRLVLLSLGKLGGRELNYSSDIDLLFLYEQEGQTAGGEADAVPNSEYFARLAADAVKIIGEPTAEGAVFRVDLRLRPDGTRGDIAVCFAAALHYYQNRARQWELQSLLKARPSAGALDVGRNFLRQVHPLIFHTPSRLEALGSALEMRREMERELRRRSASAAAKNVKLSPGGIRDIEFLAQCLQRIYGGEDPWLAAPAAGSTLVALQRLHDKAHLSGRDYFRLASAYQFLRRVEHQLQLRDGLQIHSLPSQPYELDRLARCVAIEPAGGRSLGAQLAAGVQQHFCEVREIYERILERRESAEQDIRRIPPEGATGRAAIPSRITTDFPILAEAAREAERAGSETARHGLSQYLSAAALDPALLAALESHPEWLGPAIRLMARSDLAAAMLMRHPAEIGIIADPDAARIEPLLQQASRSASPDGASLDELRIAQRQILLLLTARSALGISPPPETFEALTQLADWILGQALERLAREAVPSLPLEESPLTVLALGRLGTREMDIGSDIDLVFVIDERLSAEDREAWRKLTERLVNAVSSHTRQGLLYPVDARLRPRGAEGEMVQPASYIERYCRQEAGGWEAISYNKGRVLAGNRRLGERVFARIRQALRERFAQGEGASRMRSDLAHVRGLLEQERQIRPSHTDLKIAYGGYHDIEYVLGYRALTRGVETGGRTMLAQIDALQRAGAIDAASADALAAAAVLCRSVDHALRIVKAHRFDRPVDEATSQRVCQLLEEWHVAEAGRFERALEERRRQMAKLCDEVIGMAD